MKDPIEVVIEAMELPVGFTGDGPSGFAIIRALEEAGYLILSKEPTYEMLAEMRGALEGGIFEGILPGDQEALSAALAAAPRWSDTE